MVRSGREEAGEIHRRPALPGPGGLRVHRRAVGRQRRGRGHRAGLRAHRRQAHRPGVHRRDPAAGAGPLDRGRRRHGRLEAAGAGRQGHRGCGRQALDRDPVLRVAARRERPALDLRHHRAADPGSGRHLAGPAGPHAGASRPRGRGAAPADRRQRAPRRHHRRRRPGAGERAAGAPLRHRQDEGRGGRAAGVRAGAGPCARPRRGVVRQAGAGRRRQGLRRGDRAAPR